MINAISNFLYAIKEQGHVQQLINNADLHVTLLCNQQSFQLAVKKGRIFILPDWEEIHKKNEICGEPQAMKQLLEGKATLRSLAQMGQLKVTVPLRTALLLESIFYLTKAQEDFAKII